MPDPSSLALLKAQLIACLAEVPPLQAIVDAATAVTEAKQAECDDLEEQIADCEEAIGEDDQ